MRGLVVMVVASFACAPGDTPPPLVRAARAGDAATVRALVAQGASLEERSGVNGWTALQHAVHKEQGAVVEALLGLGADANARDRRGATALMLAAGQAQPGIVRLLLSHGAHASLRNEHGATALSNAVAAGSAEVVDALLAHDPQLTLDDGWVSRASSWVARVRGKGELLARIGHSQPSR